MYIYINIYTYIVGIFIFVFIYITRIGFSNKQHMHKIAQDLSAWILRPA